MSDEPLVACRKQAAKLLARREHSRLELERKLGQRAYDDDVITAALDELEHDGFLDETRFAESYVRLRAEKGYGPNRIRLELNERGVSRAGVAEALAAADVDWAASAREVREKRFGGDVPDAFAERARQTKFLDYRGFDRAQISAALDRAPEAD